MTRSLRPLAALLLAAGALLAPSTRAEAPIVAFGTSELRASGCTTPVVTALDPALGPQSFRIRATDEALTISGGDERGLLYGLLEAAEQYRLHGPDARLDGRSGAPFIANRGLKFNIPLDARCPSYDDTGDAAQRNLEHMWDFSFWREFLDTMARHRYNTLTLWNPNPFPVMTRLPGYPDIALDDISATTAVPGGRVGEWGDAGGVNDTVLKNLRLVRRMSIDEKIAFWRRVFRHARDRGIDVYFITWNIYTNGARGKYGLSDDIDNPANIPFYREATRVFLETYPDLKGIGVTAGERMHVPPGRDVHDARERWLWETYGRGILDHIAAHPDRTVHFIHRFWYSDFEKIQKYWAGYPHPFTFSFKYITARLYSSPERSPYAASIIPLLEAHHLKSWWNLRNDDIFVYRWGDPDYVRAFLQNLPLHLTAGFHMGSDGYVWGRVFADRSPLMAGKLELEKHWYKFMLWGRLAYDPSLDRSFFEAHLAHRYPGTDAAVLYEAWQAAARVIPQINRFMFYTGDRHWAPEACSARESFRFLPDFRVVRPLRGTGILNPRDYVRHSLAGTLPEGHVSPSAVSENLDAQAAIALDGVARLRRQDPSPELQLVLDDIAAMAWLGRFYAARIDTALALEWFDQTG
ncbi:MAG: hypothetical protein D6781_06960, partial [Verrucomicrobia bacterium]